jgi:LacI family transcriptional regulator
MNLADVARRAGVSTATVSRVMNNVGVVREETRLRVARAAEELRYYPNVHARALAGGDPRMVGLIVSNLENPFFLDVFRSLEAAAHDAAYEVLVTNTGYRPERLHALVRLMIGRRLSGLAIVVSEMDEALLDELTHHDLPIVVYDVGTPRRNLVHIKVDYRAGMQRLVSHLVELGHRRLAFVGHHPTLGPLQDRKETFLEIVRQFSAAIEYRTATGADSFCGGREAVSAIFGEGFQPTAIVCVNDFMAAGALRELRARNLRVPGDVSLTGFDDIELADILSPSLTTAHIPRDLIGRLIFESLTTTQQPREILLTPTLTLRESTAPLLQPACASS